MIRHNFTCRMIANIVNTTIVGIVPTIAIAMNIVVVIAAAGINGWCGTFSKQ